MIPPYIGMLSEIPDLSYRQKPTEKNSGEKKAYPQEDLKARVHEGQKKLSSREKLPGFEDEGGKGGKSSHESR